MQWSSNVLVRTSYCFPWMLQILIFRRAVAQALHFGLVQPFINFVALNCSRILQCYIQRFSFWLFIYSVLNPWFGMLVPPTPAPIMHTMLLSALGPASHKRGVFRFLIELIYGFIVHPHRKEHLFSVFNSCLCCFVVVIWPGTYIANPSYSPP